MAHGSLRFVMPAPVGQAFEAFFNSELRCVYSLKLRPAWLGRLLDPIASALFAYETRRRFAAMARYLAARRTA